MKLLAGSFGTLSVLTEVTLKVMPKPETVRTILLRALADEIASPDGESAEHALRSLGAAHLPRPAPADPPSRRSARPGAITAIRLEGPAPSVAFRVEAIEPCSARGERLDDRIRRLLGGGRRG